MEQIMSMISLLIKKSYRKSTSITSRDQMEVMKRQARGIGAGYYDEDDSIG